MKRGQIWVETVIYTLIGLSLIGLVLAIVTPKINEFRDRSIIEQTINSLNALDKKINEVTGAPGNSRKVEFQMKRGELYFNSDVDSIEFIFEDSKAVFSEPGVSVSIGRVNVTTTESGSRYDVALLLTYQHNLTFENSEDNKKFTGASVPYQFIVENKGFHGVGHYNIDIREV